MELSNITRLAPLSGATLSTEEYSGLEVAMLQRKLAENLPGRMYFWGKIFGSTQDYLVVHNINPFAEFPVKKYYYCTTSDYVLRALPMLSADYQAQADKLSIPFTGDPSFFAFYGEEAEAEPEDPEAPPVERFREVHRLSSTVKKIDRDCSLIPRGAVVVDASKKVIFNAYFTGLSFQTACESRAYMHFRRPESLQAQALLRKPGIVKSSDFLDCINKDTPTEMWSIAHDTSGTIASVRNHYWDGYTFYSVLQTNEYGGAYFGNGLPNVDIAFML